MDIDNTKDFNQTSPKDIGHIRQKKVKKEPRLSVSKLMVKLKHRSVLHFNKVVKGIKTFTCLKVIRNIQEAKSKLMEEDLSDEMKTKFQTKLDKETAFLTTLKALNIWDLSKFLASTTLSIYKEQNTSAEEFNDNPNEQSTLDPKVVEFFQNHKKLKDAVNDMEQRISKAFEKNLKPMSAKKNRNESTRKTYHGEGKEDEDRRSIILQKKDRGLLANRKLSMVCILSKPFSIDGNFSYHNLFWWRDLLA